MARKYIPPAYMIKRAKDKDGIDCRLVAYVDRSSHLAEQYKTMRTNLYSLSREKQIKTVVITSSQVGEGKTVTSCNLAVTLSHDKAKRVILIDADMRKPAAHPLLGIPREPGFSDILRGRSSLETFVARPVLEDLYFIPAGTEVEDPTDLLIPENLEPFIRKLSLQFDCIVFDTPPVLEFTDACMLGSVCDAVIMVVKAASTQESAIEEAVTLLEETQAMPKGCIMTSALNLLDTQQYLYRK